VTDEPVRCEVDPDVAAEFPGLALWSQQVTPGAGRTKEGLKERLRLLSSRFHGAHAIVMRREPVPSAYRAFFRQVGLDPDSDRTPIEAAALERLRAGSFRSRDRLSDALLVALVETGVPVWALDEDTLAGPLSLRPAGPGERLGTGEYANDLPAGRLVIADPEGPVAVLFGELAPDRQVVKATLAVRLFAVQVAGVPEVHVSEALWTCAEALSGR
jgi:DNA/RNA-binding domain of Phe-tRNA-synthetase-like protein